jgi:Leucine-rich repeat (LRR) protein
MEIITIYGDNYNMNTTQLFLDQRYKIQDQFELIFKLINLKKLSLNFNYIPILPESIINLIKLEELYLKNISITDLPESLFKLTKLKKLNLSLNNISYIPDSISKLSNLEILNLSSNKISDISESILKLTNLEKLYLNNNLINILPQSICNLFKLKDIDISFNPISYILKPIYKLPKLQYIGMITLGQIKHIELLYKLQNYSRIYINSYNFNIFNTLCKSSSYSKYVHLILLNKKYKNLYFKLKIICEEFEYISKKILKIPYNAKILYIKKLNI